MELNSLTIRTLSLLGSCGAYGMAMKDLAKDNDKIIALSADLCSFSGLTGYAQDFSTQFFNVGIAEQNMVGIASGMAKEGLIPYVNSYAAFLSMR